VSNVFADELLECQYDDCGRPVPESESFWKISAFSAWGRIECDASLGLYCSLECANAEPTATLTDARAMRHEVASGCPCGYCDVDTYVTIWDALIDQCPAPISTLDLPHA